MLYSIMKLHVSARSGHRQEAMIARADKGNSLVILPTAQYETKVEDFIQTNHFQSSAKDPTKSLQTHVRKVVNNSKTLIPPRFQMEVFKLKPHCSYHQRSNQAT